MMKRILLAFAFFASPVQAQPYADDWHFATHILDGPYVDMPNLVTMPGVLGAAVTYNANAAEGYNPDQHVAFVRSTDGGVTWGSPIAIEPSSSPEASWVVPYYDAANDKLYAFYVYNFENVRSIPDNDASQSTTRVDSIGKIAYRVSSDKGLTWSTRTLITIPARAIDLRNPYAGSKQLLWMFGQARELNGQVYLGYSKMGTVDGGNLFIDTEAFLLRADVGAGGLSNFTVLPGGSGQGMRAPTPFWGGAAPLITEEPAFFVHSDGVIDVYSRTEKGRLAESYSSNGGSSFTNDWARQTGGSLTIYHPRGPAMTFTLPDGRLLLLTYNNGEPDFKGRNPIWYRLGTRVGNRIEWGDPSALIYYQDMDTRLGYPSAAVVGSELLIALSDKTSARVLRFDLGDF